MSEESKPYVVKSHDIRLDSDYVIWVHDVKQRYVSAQIKSAVKVNTERPCVKYRELEMLG